MATTMTLSKFEKCEWPYDSQAARTITCYVTKAPRAKLYIWHDGPFDGSWNYTMSAGRNSERSHSGRVAIANLGIAEAVAIAIHQVKKSNSWEI